MPPQGPQSGDITRVVNRRVGLQIRLREIEKRHGGSEPVLLQVHEGPGELDQALIKCVIGRGPAARQPEFLQYLVRLKK